MGMKGLGLKEGKNRFWQEKKGARHGQKWLNQIFCNRQCVACRDRHGGYPSRHATECSRFCQYMGPSRPATPPRLPVAALDGPKAGRKMNILMGNAWSLTFLLFYIISSFLDQLLLLYVIIIVIIICYQYYYYLLLLYFYYYNFVIIIFITLRIVGQTTNRVYCCNAWD